MRLAAYCRVSTDKDDQLNSLDKQKEFFEEYARQCGCELFRVYADEGITGTSLRRRTEFKRLMNDAQYGMFDTVVVKDVSRFARNTVDFLQNIRALKSMGIGTTFVTNNMTTLGDSEFILTIFGAMAQEESANLSKRVKFGKDINSKKGRVPPRIFGYDRVDNFTLKINEKEAEIVRDIYEMYIEKGYGCRLIALELDRSGAETKFGGRWNPRGVRRVLDNPIYCGHYVNHKYYVENFLDGKVKAASEDQYYHHDRPEWAIISADTFQQAQKVREERQIKYKNNDVHKTGRYSSKHLFSTLIKCECCGRSFCRYHRGTDEKPYNVWRCTTNNQYTAERCQNNTIIREEELKEQLAAYFTSLLQDKKGLAEKIIKANKVADGNKKNKKSKDSLVRNKAHLEKHIERYTEMYANDVIDLKTLKEKVDKIRSEINEIECELQYDFVDDQKQKDARREVEQYIKEIERFITLETATNVDLRKVISRISVSQDHVITIHLKEFPSTDESA